MQISTIGHDAPTRTPIPRFVAWLLLAPAAVLLMFSYVLPTVLIARASLSTEEGRSGWSFVFSGRFLGTLGYALSYALAPITILATVALAFAWAASRAGLAARLVARGMLALPLAAFAPTGLALAWMAEHMPGDGYLPPTARPSWDGRIAMISTLGLFVAAVGVVCYLAALRRRNPEQPTRRGLAVVGVLLGIVALGIALQQYTFIDLIDDSPISRSSGFGAMLPLTLGIPDRAPVALTTMIILAVLGVAVAVLVRRTGLRIEFDPAMRSADDAAGPRRGALVGTIVGVAVLVALIVVLLGPWLAAVVSGDGRRPSTHPAVAILVTTWVAPLLTALVQVVFAALAGFAIAVGRPLGRRSWWLLLAMAPWLLMGNALLEFARVDPEKELSERRLLELLWTYAPPSWISIPAIFLFALLFHGLARQWLQERAAGQPYAFARTMWPALPMVAFAVGVQWLMQAQDLLTPTLMDLGDGVVPHGQLLLGRMATVAIASRQWPDLALGYPLWALILFTAGALVFQLLYLDRIAVRVGDEAV